MSPMFCPACGAPGQNVESFCTRCGEWLPNMTKRSRHGGPAKPEDRMKQMLVFSAISAVFGLFSAVALYATYLGTSEAKWSVYLAGSFCMVIAVHQTINFFFALELRQRLKRARTNTSMLPKEQSGQRPLSLDAAHTMPFVDPQSVTENTTELLDPVPRKRAS